MRKTAQHRAGKVRMSTAVTPTMQARYDAVIEGVTKIGYLLVISKKYGGRNYNWHVQCFGQDGKCGKIFWIRRALLFKRIGAQKSCGCMTRTRGLSEKKLKLSERHQSSDLKPEIYRLCFSRSWSVGK